jgi:hypothetical protein
MTLDVWKMSIERKHRSLPRSGGFALPFPLPIQIQIQILVDEVLDHWSFSF